jgi:hypothetical protein
MLVIKKPKKCRKNIEFEKKSLVGKIIFIILQPITTVTDGVTVALQILVLSV